MGIVEFFGTITNNKITRESVIEGYTKAIKTDHILIDFNSIVHVVSSQLLEHVNLLLYSSLSHLYNANSRAESHSMDLPHNVYRISELKGILRDFGLDIVRYIRQGTTPEQIIALFHEFFTQDKLDALIIYNVGITVVDVVRTYCVKNKLQTIMIAIDGVPSKGKLMEQRQRRYMGAIASEYNKVILERHRKTLQKMPYYSLLAAQQPIVWAKINITPGTYFMEKMAKYLKSKQFQQELGVGFPEVNIVISDVHEVGEGEKKIVNYIETNFPGSQDNIIVYSPDSDVILLCMLLSTPNTYMLRHNQQTSGAKAVYDLVKIKHLKKSIGDYIQSSVEQQINTERVNRDIVFIATLFGNDFVPKMETISISNDFDAIISAYIDILTGSESPRYLIRYSKSAERYILSQSALTQYLSALTEIEHSYIHDNEGYRQYTNYGHIKRLLSTITAINSENVTDVISQVSQFYGLIKRDINNNMPIQDIVDTRVTDTAYFDVVKRAIGSMQLGDSIYDVTTMNDYQFLQLLRDYHMANKGSKFSFPNVKLRLFTPIDTIHNNYYRPLNVKSMNPYQLEKKQFELKVDGYSTMFNSGPLDLSTEGVRDFYKEYFHVKQSYNGIHRSTCPIIKHYIQALLWVFNYYFNDTSYLNTWYYQYERSPLLKHIVDYLTEIDSKAYSKIENSLDNYHVDVDDYLNPVEQMIYVSPLIPDIINLFPVSYRDYFMKMCKKSTYPKFMKKYYMSVPAVVRSIEEGDTNIIDCRSIRYLSKCILIGFNKPDDKFDDRFITFMRETFDIAKVDEPLLVSVEPEF